MVSTSEQNHGRLYQNDAACTAMRAVRCPIVDGGTQWMVLSAAVNSLMVCSAREGTGSVLWSAAATNIAFETRGLCASGAEVAASLPSAPRSSPGAEAGRAIESDLGAISPGRATAGGGHGRLAEGERAF